MLVLLLMACIQSSLSIGFSTDRPLFGAGRTDSVHIPLNGPCILNNDDHLKCTEKGYYEMVQCDDNSCFCVDAHNGDIAEGTRTDNKRTAPKCSGCHNYIKGLFARGEPPKNSFVPNCDSELGDYSVIQCDSTNEFCFCVDEKTGKEVAGSKKKREHNKIFNCGDSPAPSTTTTELAPVGKEYCRLDRDRGHTCNNASSRVMYYFEASIFTCLAFEHKGCGGNQNRFYSKEHCQETCMLMDFSSCSGMSPPAKDRQGQVITCGGMMMEKPRPASVGLTLNSDGCPQNFRCVMGAFFGFCCDKKNEEMFDRAYHPKCARGQAYSQRKDGFQRILLGKACSDNFCPRGFHCEQGEVLAHCCPS